MGLGGKKPLYRNINYVLISFAICGPIIVIGLLIFQSQKTFANNPSYVTYRGDFRFVETRLGSALVLDDRKPVWVSCVYGRPAYGCVESNELKMREPLTVEYVKTSERAELITGVLRKVVQGDRVVISYSERKIQISRTANHRLVAFTIIALAILGFFAVFVRQRGLK